MEPAMSQNVSVKKLRDEKCMHPRWSMLFSSLERCKQQMFKFYFSVSEMTEGTPWSQLDNKNLLLSPWPKRKVWSSEAASSCGARRLPKAKSTRQGSPKSIPPNSDCLQPNSDGLQTHSDGCQPNIASNLIAMASNLIAMASNLIAMASNQIAMVSNLITMASKLIAMVANLI